MMSYRSRIALLTLFLFGLIQCSVETLGPLGGTNTRGDMGGSISDPTDSSGGNYFTDPSNSSSSGDAPENDTDPGRGSFTPGTPVDIPVPVAKVVNPRSINALLVANQEVVYTARSDPNVTVRLYDQHANAIREVTTDEEGNFSVTVPLASVPIESPIAFVVTDAEISGPPITVMTYGDNTFTVALTAPNASAGHTIGSHTFEVANLSNYSIGDWPLAYSPRCQGVAYNATNLTTMHYSILCVNTLDASNVILANQINKPLDQMHFSADGKTLVGLTPDKHLIHVDLDTGLETVISDMPIDVERPTIRLSPDGKYVLTTGRVVGSPHQLAVLEPVNFNPATAIHDRIVINRVSATESITECEFIPNSTEIQCVFKDDQDQYCCFAPGVDYNMLRYDIGPALAANDRNPEIEPEHLSAAVMWRDKLKNLRVRPASSIPFFTYETDTELRMNDYTTDSLIANVGLYGALTAVNNSIWAADGKYLYLNATFNSGAHPGKPKVLIYTPPERLEWSTFGSYCFAGYGVRPTWADPNDSDILAYICDDQRGGKQICVLNKDTLN